MRFLVTGGHGMLGQDLLPLLTQAGHDVRAPRHADAPLEEKGTLEVWLGGWTPEQVIHLAAYTDVDGCEKDEARARASNAVATERVAALAFRWDAPMTYLSTDYVFDGSAQSPIPPEAHPAPLNAYGRTKLHMEHMLDDYSRAIPRHFVHHLVRQQDRQPVVRGEIDDFTELLRICCRQTVEAEIGIRVQEELMHAQGCEWNSSS